MEALLPFAKQVATGRTVAVDEVERGAECGCVCLFCDAPMQAKKGAVNIHHFAHMPRAVEDERECPASFERCVFWMARRILSESQSFRVPQYDRLYVDLRSGARRELPLKVTIEKDVAYSCVSFPFTLSEQKHVDVALIDVAGHQLAIKIIMEPIFLMPFTKAYQTASEKVATVVVSLGDARYWFKERSRSFRQELEGVLLRSIGPEKCWVYHPREESIKFPGAEISVADGVRYVVAPRSQKTFRDAKTGRMVTK